MYEFTLLWNTDLFAAALLPASLASSQMAIFKQLIINNCHDPNGIDHFGYVAHLTSLHSACVCSLRLFWGMEANVDCRVTAMHRAAHVGSIEALQVAFVFAPSISRFLVGSCGLGFEWRVVMYCLVLFVSSGAGVLWCTGWRHWNALRSSGSFTLGN